MVNILDLCEEYAIFSFNYEGVELEIHINDYSGKDESLGNGEAIFMECPAMPLTELNMQRIARDFNVLGYTTIPLYEERYKGKTTKKKRKKLWL